VYTGGGVILNNASEALTRLVRLLGFPVTNTLMGLGGFPGTDPQFTGMLGMHGTYESNMAMQNCDVLLAVGSRFDDRVIGNPAHFYRADRKIIGAPGDIGKAESPRFVCPCGADGSRTLVRQRDGGIGDRGVSRIQDGPYHRTGNGLAEHTGTAECQRKETARQSLIHIAPPDFSNPRTNLTIQTTCFRTGTLSEVE